MDQSSAGRGKGKRSRCRNREADWSLLSPEFLLAIGKRLESRVDVCKFRSVCKNWRSSLPLPQNPNILNPLLPVQLQIPKANPLPFTENYHNFFTVVATTVLLVQPLDSDPNHNSISKCWILSVEERKPGKFRILYPVSRDPVAYKDPTFPKNLNLAEFRVSEIGKGYLLRVLAREDRESGYLGCKVILCLTSAEKCPYSTADNCTAIVLYSNGTLIGLRLRNGNWGYVHQSLALRFKDVLWLGGSVYAVDDGGRLYVIDHMTLKMTDTIVCHPIGKGFCSIRLVGSLDDVYLVVVSRKKFYQLNRMQRKWDEMNTLGNMTVFLGFDGSFMVSTQSLFGCNGNFMIFNPNIFDAYDFDESGFREAAKDIGILMYCFRTGVMRESQIEWSYQAISNSLWPPPTWFWQDTFLSNRDAANNLQPGAYGQWSLNSHKKATTHPPQAGNQLPNVESSKGVASKVRFEGVDIRSDLVSTLQKIWAKHGNVVEGSSVYSKEMLKCALKSLAKAVTILQSSSGRTLSKSQCDDLSSTLMDLKHLQLRVEWLEPFVEKAVKLHESKPMVDALEDLEKNIAKAKEMKMKYAKELAHLEEVEKELEKGKTLVSEKIPIVGRVDLDQCIGDGLL